MDGNSFYDVTFQAKVGGGEWTTIGTDDNEPVPRLPRGRRARARHDRAVPRDRARQRRAHAHERPRADPGRRAVGRVDGAAGGRPGARDRAPDRGGDAGRQRQLGAVRAQRRRRRLHDGRHAMRRSRSTPLLDDVSRPRPGRPGSTTARCSPMPPVRRSRARSAAATVVEPVDDRDHPLQPAGRRLRPLGPAPVRRRARRPARRPPSGRTRRRSRGPTPTARSTRSGSPTTRSRSASSSTAGSRAAGTPTPRTRSARRTASSPRSTTRRSGSRQGDPTIYFSPPPP